MPPQLPRQITERLSGGKHDAARLHVPYKKYSTVWTTNKLSLQMRGRYTELPDTGRTLLAQAADLSMLHDVLYLCADFTYEVDEGCATLRAAQVRQFAAQRHQVLLEGPQTLHEPPPRAAARLELTLLLRSPHKHRYLCHADSAAFSQGVVSFTSQRPSQASQRNKGAMHGHKIE